MKRIVLRSDACDVRVPSLNLDNASGTGRFTTIQGLLDEIKVCVINHIRHHFMFIQYIHTDASCHSPSNYMRIFKNFLILTRQGSPQNLVFNKNGCNPRIFVVFSSFCHNQTIDYYFVRW
jgi:hypothetical protein